MASVPLEWTHGHAWRDLGWSPVYQMEKRQEEVQPQEA